MPVFFLKETLMLNCADIGQRPAAGENAINQVATSLVELSHLSMLCTLCLALDAAVTTLDSARVVSPVQRPPDTQPPCLDGCTELLCMMCWPQGAPRAVFISMYGIATMLKPATNVDWSDRIERFFDRLNQCL